MFFRFFEFYFVKLMLESCLKIDGKAMHISCLSPFGFGKNFLVNGMSRSNPSFTCGNVNLVIGVGARSLRHRKLPSQRQQQRKLQEQ
jgi:hypothetical protein